jgi:O-antigen/teichoic acid export membrane protein
MKYLFTAAKNRIYRFLRWSERHTKTDMVYLTKGGSWTMLLRGISTVAGLSLSIAFANLIPQDVFGNYKYVLTLAGILSAFSLTGMGSVVSRAVARGFEGTVTEALKMNLRWSTGMVALSLIGSAYYFFNDNQFLGTSLLITAATLPLIHSFNLTSPYLKGCKEFQNNTWYSLPRTLFPPIAIVCALLLTDNPLVLIGVYFSAQALIVVGTYTYMRMRRTLNAESDHSALHFSKHLSAMNVLERLSSSIDSILIFHFLGAAPLAIYSFAVAPIRELNKTRGFLLAPAFPKLSQRGLAELQRSLPWRIGLAMALLVPVIAAYILTAPLVYDIVFPQYTESVIYSQVFALTLILLPVPLFVQTLTAHLKHPELYTLKISTAIFRITSIAILIPLFGIWGAIIAIASAKTFRGILAFWLFKRAAT